MVRLHLALQAARRPRPAWWRPRRSRPVAGPRTARPAARAPGPGPGAPRAAGRRTERWISASVWSTESWTWAAIWARSSASARAWRSAMRSRTRLSHQGPKMITLAATTRTAPPTGRSAATVVWPSTSSTIPPAPIRTPTATRAMSQRRPPPWVSAPRSGTTSWSMKAFSDSLALRQIRISTPRARKVGHPMNPTKAEVQGARDELHRDQHRDEDGGDQADAAAVVDGARVDVGGLALHGDQQPRHGVDEHHHAAADGEQHEADAHPGGVDPGRRRDGAAHAAEDAVVRGPAQACAASCRRGGLMVPAASRSRARPGTTSARRSRPIPLRAAAHRPIGGTHVPGADRGGSVGRPPSVSGRVPGSGASVPLRSHDDRACPATVGYQGHP